MAGTPPTSAPQRIVPPLADQPISGTEDGRPSYPMIQWMQRISAQVGPVVTTGTPGTAGGSGAPGFSLSEQVSNLTTVVNQMVTAGFTDPTIAQQIRNLNTAVLRAQFAPPVLPRAQPSPAFPEGPTGVIYLANGSRILDGFGAPNGAEFGSTGDQFLQLDGTTAGGVLWVKTSGHNTDTGWTQGGGSAGGAIYAPLVNGDLPGPHLISDPFGQTVMVQIR
jgi:hypothetical protein